MPIQFNNDLQKFYDYINTEIDNNRQDDDAAVQFGADKTLGAATKTAGAVRRWFCLTDGASAACKANNEVRSALLNALSSEYKGLENIPESVKDVLKFKDFGYEKRSDGSVAFKSGKPLTQRRILQILNAVIEDRDAQITTLQDQLTTHTPGEKFTPKEAVLHEVLDTNPKLIEKPGLFNRTGIDVSRFASLRFNTFLQKLDNAGQIDYLTNYKTHLRQAAQFSNDLANIAATDFDKLFNNQTIIDKLNAPDRSGKPADERRIALRKKIIGNEIFRDCLTQALTTPYDADANYYLDQFHKKLWAENGEPSKRVLSEFRSDESIVDIAYSFETEVKAKFGIDLPDDVIDGVVSSAIESRLQGQNVKDCAKRATGFVEMFQSVLNAYEPDREKALKVFSGIVHVDVAKPKYINFAKELVDSLANVDLELPAKPTNESMHRFYRNLAEKIRDKMQAFGRKQDGFGSQDIHDFAAPFIMMLFTKREDAKEWLHVRTDAELNLFSEYIANNERENLTDVRESIDEHLATVLSEMSIAAKVYVD